MSVFGLILTVSAGRSSPCVIRSSGGTVASTVSDGSWLSSRRGTRVRTALDRLTEALRVASMTSILRTTLFVAPPRTSISTCNLIWSRTREPACAVGSLSGFSAGTSKICDCWIPRTIGVFFLIEGSPPPSWTVGLPPHLLSHSGGRASRLLGAGSPERVWSNISGTCSVRTRMACEAGHEA